MVKSTVVGIADMKLIRNEGVLITYALGSCVGVCLYDQEIKLAAMVHVMLPDYMPNSSGNVYKFADVGIKETLRKMEIFGAKTRRITAKIVGGAKMFDTIPGSSFGCIGERNIVAVKKMLQIEQIRLLKEDVGKNYARTLSFDSTTGVATVRTIGKPDLIL